MVVIRVVTHCETADAFVATFAKLSTDSSIFIPTQKMRTVGVETGFSIRLADGTPALRGLCVVEGSYVDGDNAYKRPGVLLGIRKLTADSQPVFARLRDPMLPLITTEQTQTGDARISAIEQIQKIAATGVMPTLPLLQGKQIAVTGTDVTGVQDTLDATFLFRFWKIGKTS